MYFQSDTLLLADVSDNFRNIYLKIYKVDPAKFVSDLEISWQLASKKTKGKLDLLTDIDILLMKKVENVIREGIHHSEICQFL